MHLLRQKFRNHHQQINEDMTMWNAPEYNDIRFGFEVTMYINNK